MASHAEVHQVDLIIGTVLVVGRRGRIFNKKRDRGGSLATGLGRAGSHSRIGSNKRKAHLGGASGVRPSWLLELANGGDCQLRGFGGRTQVRPRFSMLLMKSPPRLAMYLAMKRNRSKAFTQART